MNKALALLIAALVLALAAPAAAQEAQVTALGAAAGEDSQARDKAVRQALRQAVGQAAAGLMDAATLRAKLAELDKRVLARAEDLVSSYSVEASTTEEGRTLVLVAAHMDMGALQRILAESGLRLQAGGVGRVLVLVAEENAPGRPPVYWWSPSGAGPPAPPAAAQVLGSLGVKPVEPGEVAWRWPDESRGPEVSQEMAVELGRQAKADLVLLGRLRTYPLVTPQGQKPDPVAQLMALDPKTGQPLAVVEAQGPVFHAAPTPAQARQVEAAAEQAVRDALGQATAKGMDSAPKQGPVLLELSGVRSLGQLKRFEDVLAGLEPLVSAVRRVSAGAGRATYELTARVTPSRLADELIVKDYGEFLINVADAGSSKLSLVIIPR